jgi:hypothetical protein
MNIARRATIALITGILSVTGIVSMASPAEAGRDTGWPVMARDTGWPM